MKAGSVIHRYIFRELIPPCMLSIAFLLFVFMMTELINLTDMVVNYRVGFTTVLLLMGYAIPAFLQFIIPMSTMIGVLLAFLKMSSDNEVVAMKAGGMSVYAMMPPVLIFCLIGCAVTAFMGIYGQPWGRFATKSLTAQLDTASIATMFTERTFSNFNGNTLYVTHVTPGQSTLGGVFIEDKSIEGRAFTITAPEGRLVGDPEAQLYHLQLINGQINTTDVETRSVGSTRFETCRILLDLTDSVTSTRAKGEKEMSLSELRHFIETRKDKRDERYYLANIAYHGKFALPFACFALGILGVPLGIQSKSARRSFGIGLGLFFFLGYYLILSAGEVYGRTGYYPPLIGMWMPNIVLGGIGLVLLVRCARERAIGIVWLLGLFSRRPHPGADVAPPPSPPSS